MFKTAMWRAFFFPAPKALEKSRGGAGKTEALAFADSGINMPDIKKIAIPGRGEIARRLILSCHQMGIETVLLHASGDADSEAFRLAGEAVCIGPAEAAASYLNGEAAAAGALAAGARAIHPGYGFLSESADFARLCADRGLVFIGPPPEALEIFGNKIKARRFCEKEGVPVLPGALIKTAASRGNKKSEAEKSGIQKARSIGYPLMLKAAGGGGGIGLRAVRTEGELRALIPLVRREAEKAFQSDQVFLEKYLPSAKHIEIQAFVSADGEAHILGDRDCSAQRRRQKIIEEAPSAAPKRIKKQMAEAARAIFRAIKYRGPGTAEFLLQGENFYFLEVNARLQVEHTVTEMIFGLDLARAQILTAMGEPAFPPPPGGEFEPRGHSIQCRICAEDPERGFLPAAGRLLECAWPRGHGIRADTGFQKGDSISPLYDSLIGKIIVCDSYRARAAEKMKKALEETIVFGVPVNIPFLRYILSHPLFAENKITAESIEALHASEWQPEPFPFEDGLMERVFEGMAAPAAFDARGGEGGRRHNPWLSAPKP